jgi:hypothetical protein
MAGSLIPADQPPKSFNEEQAEWLNRMFHLARLSDQNSDIIPTHVASVPAKPKIGKVYFFAAAIPATAITGEGYWGYKSTGWVLLG